MLHFLRRLTQPKVFVPIIIGTGLLIGLIVLAGPHEALRLIGRFQPIYLVAFAVLMAGYEVVRCVQWHYMLRQLDVNVPLRTQILAYGIGEFTKNLPIGNFVPDAILTREAGTDFGRASSSSLLVSVLEVAVALAGIVIIGVDGWNWLRPVILIGSFAFALLVWVFYSWHHSTHPTQPQHPGHAPRWALHILRWRWVRNALDEVREFGQGEATLLHPHVIAISALACMIYMVLSGLALYAVVQGLGFSGITWDEALVASFFSLAVSTIIPLPTDLGSSEASGAGVLVALGLTASAGISTLLLYRFLNLVEQIAVALLVIILFPRAFRAMWRGRKHTVPPQSA